MVVALALALLLGLVATPTEADTRPEARLGALWLAGQVEADGTVRNPDDTVNVGAVIDIALALAAVGVEQATFDAIVGYLEANVEEIIVVGGNDNPGRIGQLLLIADAAGVNGAAFGGVDLPARLAGTLGASVPGLYGADDPTFDGAYRQSVAVLGLVAGGVAVPAAAVDWLRDQQCDGSGSPSADGGWMAYRADLTVPCPAPDPMTFSGPDTNQTALAVQALAAVELSPVRDPFAFLASAQTADGGYGYLPGQDADPNSTALVIQALVSRGIAPAGQSTPSGGDPLSSLIGWQFGCDSEFPGAFRSAWSGDGPDLFASRQAVWGVAERAFPLGTVTFVDAGDPCAPQPPTPPGPTTPTTGSAAAPVASPGAASATPASAAAPVAAAARFTG